VVVLVAFGLVSSAALAQDRDAAQIEQARVLFAEGARAYGAGRLREALQKMKAAHRSFRRPEFAFNIGRVLERMGEAEHAISWFRVYLAHGSPNAAERADVDRRIAELEALRERVEGQLIAAPPSTDELATESRTFFERGVAMYERGQYDAAMQAFEYAQQFAPFPELYYNMAITAERLERYGVAADHYRSYLRGRPEAAGRALIEQKVQELRERERRRR
jgi:tetratricopeptide (TPR) repeat protein